MVDGVYGVEDVAINDARDRGFVQWGASGGEVLTPCMAGSRMTIGVGFTSSTAREQACTVQKFQESPATPQHKPPARSYTQPIGEEEGSIIPSSARTDSGIPVRNIFDVRC